MKIIEQLSHEPIQAHELPTENYIEEDSFGLYLDMIGKRPLLSREDENLLAKRMNIGLEAAARIIALANCEEPKDYQELSRLKHEGEQAAIELLESNLRYVVWHVKRYKVGGASLPEKVQAGNMGLAKAMSRFDVERGTKLITYAKWWIWDALNKLERSQERQSPISLEQLTEAGFDYGTVSAEEVATTNLLFEDVAQEVKVALANHQKGPEAAAEAYEVMYHRLGLGSNGQQMTIKEISDALGLSAARVTQIQVSALDKLRKNERIRQLLVASSESDTEE